MYLKFLNDYRNYDYRQKIRIADLRKRIEYLEWEVDDLRIALEDSDDFTSIRLRTKLKNQRSSLIANENAIRKLRHENKIMALKIEELNNEIEILKQNNRQQSQEGD